jgi:hypothetical protein
LNLKINNYFKHYDYLYNYENNIPQTTLRELTQDIIKLTNFTGPSGQIKGYLYNYINSIPDTTFYY